jgi:hypothetical protein
MGNFQHPNVITKQFYPATANLEVPLMVVPANQSVRLVKAYGIDGTTISAATDNYVTLYLYNRGTAAAGTAVMASGVGTAGLTANVPKALTLSTTDSELVASAGELITAKLGKTGSGVGTTVSVSVTFVFST